MITHLEEVHTACRKLLAQPSFVLDIETLRQPYPNPRTNEVTWIGLGGPGEVFLIPLGHPKGFLLERAHKEKRSVHEIYPPGHPKTLTPGGKLRKAHEDVTVPARYGDPPPQLNPAEVLSALKPLLFSDRAKVGHNIKFDVQSLAKYYNNRTPPGPYHDTILIRHTLEEDLDDYGLKSLTCEWLRIPTYRRKTFYPNLGDQGVENFGLDEVARYLAKDLRYSWLQFRFFYPRLVAAGLQGVYDFEMSVYPVIMDIEQRGFPINREALGTVRDELRSRLAEIEQHCWQEAGGQFPLSHTDSKRWVMFGEGPKPAFDPGTKKPLRSQHLKVLSRTPENRIPQVTQAVLEHYADRGNQMAAWFLEWSMLEKLRGTFVEGIDGLLTTHDGELPRIHTSFRQHGTVTGRFSSSQPNLQQMPRGSTIRDLFVAGPGNVLIVMDYDQIELRCLAKEANERTMIRIFIEGRDIHREAAAAAMGLRVEDVDDARRQVGKTLNFATGYGAGPAKIAAVAGTSMRRGSQFLTRYYEQFSGLEPWKERMLSEARTRGNRANPTREPPHVVIPPIGRLRRLPDLYHPEDWRRYRAERQAINAIIQGFASNITKMAMIRLANVLEPYPAKMMVQVHDEIVLQCDETAVDEVLPLAVEAMSGISTPEGPILGRIPLVVSAKTGYTWAQAKGK